MKVHVVYDPHHDLPRVLDITDANVNDAQVGRTIAIIPDATYVFDKGYAHYRWWAAIHEAQSVFVTRPKENMGLRVLAIQPLAKTQGDGFVVLADEDVPRCRARAIPTGRSTLSTELERARQWKSAQPPSNTYDAEGVT